ncbi:hypothetical protein GCM10007116_05220 [Sulfodiicoccus acidiphilus]|uniref:Uncharacterized protein n=1 Tax=Sulfodiicoccus acidiphilus TaxID=1670455 RepID=A0A830H0Q4_9CREN|nr:hypothetical protein GCM10007116_05220 [Sulfodiicoccus acidiphilus]
MCSSGVAPCIMPSKNERNMIAGKVNPSGGFNNRFNRDISIVLGYP